MLNKITLKKILSLYNIGPLKSYRKIPSSGNLVYLLKTNGGEFLLRLCGKDLRWRSEEEIKGELELLNYLSRDNFPVFSAVPMINGQRIVKWEDRSGYLRNYIKGRSLKNPTSFQAEQAGQIVGWYHKSVEGYKVKAERRIWDLEETKKYFRKHKFDILKSELKNPRLFIKRVEKELARLKFPQNLPKGMLHEDLAKRHFIWQAPLENRSLTGQENQIGARFARALSPFGQPPPFDQKKGAGSSLSFKPIWSSSLARRVKGCRDFNLLKFRDDKIVGIIDFDRSYYGPLLLDLGPALRSWCFVNWDYWSNKNLKSFLRGYQKKRPLSKLELKYLYDAVKFSTVEREVAFWTRAGREKENKKAQKSRRGLFTLLDELESKSDFFSQSLGFKHSK